MNFYPRILLLLISAAVVQGPIERLVHYWDYDKSAPLNVKQFSVQDRDGVRVFDISYSSPVGDRASLVGPNGGVVTAYLVVPPGKGPFPAIIYGHWCMQGSDKKNRTEFLDEAIVMAHSGVISLLPDHVIVHPGFVPDPTPLNDQTAAVEVQQDVNLRRGADLLLSRKDVDPKRIAYVGHSCDGTAGAFLSGIDKRFKAFVIMAGDLSDEVDSKTKAYAAYREQIGPEKVDAFNKKYYWMEKGQYVAHSAPASMFLQYATDERFIAPDTARQYLEIVGEPKSLKIYDAPHAVNAAPPSIWVAFLAEQLSVKPPDPKAVAGVPALVQPPYPSMAIRVSGGWQAFGGSICGALTL